MESCGSDPSLARLPGPHTHRTTLVSWKPNSQDTINGIKNPPASTLVLHQSKLSDTVADLPDVRLVLEGIQGNGEASGLSELQHLNTCLQT